MTSARQAILDGAAREFVHHGFVASSISDIAAASGVAKATVLYHFTSKDALLLELLDPLIERIGSIAELDPPTTRLGRQAVLRQVAEAVYAHASAAAILASDQILWRSPVFEGRMMRNQERLVDLLLHDRVGTEWRARAYAALATVFRSTAAGLEIQGTPTDPRSPEGRIVLRIAMELLDGAG